MKACFITWFFSPHIGGVESISLDELKFLTKKGINATVLTGLYDDKLSRSERIDKVQVLRTEFLNPHLPDKANGTKLKKWLKANLTKLKPDLIHAHNLSYVHGPERSKIIFQVAKELKIPIIEHCHNAQKRNPKITQELVRLDWDKIICVSNYSKTAMLEQGAERRKIEVLYNCVDSKKFDPGKAKRLSNLKFSNKKILFFPARIFTTSGELNPNKPIKPILEALKTLKEEGIENFKLVIIGNKTLDPQKAAQSNRQIEKLFVQYGLGNDYVKIDELAHNQMADIYFSADVVLGIFPQEPFGLAFVEAMLMEKPIVCPATGAGPEIIKNKKTGFVVDLKQKNVLANLLKDLLQNKFDFQKMGGAARCDAMDRFSIKRHGTKLLEIYRSLGTR